MGKFMKECARSATSVKIKNPRIVTLITEEDKEYMNRIIRPKLKQNHLEREIGLLYLTGKLPKEEKEK